MSSSPANRPPVARLARIGWACASALAVGLSGLTPPQSYAAEPETSSESVVGKEVGKPQGAEATETRIAADQFVRIVRNDARQPLTLETSVLSFRGAHPAGGELQVDLVSAVHLADKSYYDQLNERFQQYDAVLYELVAPEGTEIPRGGGGRSRHPLGATQQGMSGALDLTFQLEQVDYTPDHFVHADLSPEEFAESMRKKDESVLKLVFKMMGHSIAAQTKQGGASQDARVLAAMLSDNPSLEMKRVMAEQMADLDLAIDVFEGEKGSTLIGERNQRAIDVLQREVGQGKRKLAIFYGGAHMPDMSARLLKAFPLTQQSPQWLVAWDLERPLPNADRPAARPKQ